MTQSFLYRSPTTPAGAGYVIDIGVDATIRLGEIAGIGDEAELGAVAQTSITIDDPSGTIGPILGLKQFDWIESEAGSGNRRIWTGYIGDRTYSRDDYIFDVERRIDTTLADINSFLAFRVFQPESLDVTSSFNRPAETDVARVTALLAVDFLSDTLFDGLVSTANPVDMDAVDYAGQKPEDVLNDVAQQSGKNFFVFYDEAGTYTPDPGDFALFYDFNDSMVYLSSMQISNVDADVDEVTTFAPETTATLTLDPSRVISGVLLDYAGGKVYRSLLSTSYIYGYRDGVFSAPNVKTETKAIARADRYLLENSTEDQRLTFSVFVPAANVNDWHKGQAAKVKFSHLPGFEDYRWVRALRRTVKQDVETDQLYTIEYECTPLIGTPTGGFGYWEPGYPTYARPTLPSDTVPGDLLFMVVASQNIFSGVHIPAIPTFVDDPTGAATPGAWTTVGFVHAAGAGSPDTYVAYGIFARYVQPGETTTVPVEVQPDPTNVKCGVYLWDVPDATIPSVSDTLTSDTTGRFAEGASISLGSALTGMVVGGFAFQAGSSGHRASVTPTSGTTILLANALNGHAAPVASPSGNEPPEIWIGSNAGGPLAASFTFPYDVFNDQAVAAVVCVIPGLTKALPHINGFDEIPPNVTP